jgi:hypothetical protein
MSVEIANNELMDSVVNSINITRRRARQFDIELRENEFITRSMPYLSHNARSLIEYYLTSTIYKRKHCIGSVVVENNNKDKCECNICYEECEKHCFVKLNCSHEFCGKCINITLENTPSHKKPRCAYCRTNISNIEFSSEEAKSQFSDILCEDETSI